MESVMSNDFGSTKPEELTDFVGHHLIYTYDNGWQYESWPRLSRPSTSLLHDVSKRRGCVTFAGYDAGSVSTVLGLKLAPMGVGRPSMSLPVATTKFVNGRADPRDKPWDGPDTWVNLSAR
jgi:hypothetical protein